MASMADFEHAKENIQPIKKGRSGEALARHFGGSVESERITQLSSERKKFEDDLANYEGEDILDLWNSYINWAKESYPESMTEVVPLLERCTRELQSVATYRNDIRYLRVWLQYANSCPEPIDIFMFMKSNSIGVDLALFYEAWAAVLEARGNLQAADRIFDEGIKRGALPLTRLQKRYRDFQERAAQVIQQRMNNPEPEPSSVSKLVGDENRQALTKIATTKSTPLVGSHRPMVAKDTPMSASLTGGGLSKRTVPGSASRAPAANAPAFEIFDDSAPSASSASAAVASASAPPAVVPQPWQSLPSQSSMQKENVGRTSLWTEFKAPQDKKLAAKSKSSAPGFDVFVDPSAEAESSASSGKQLKGKQLGLRIQNDVSASARRAAELQSDPMKFFRNPELAKNAAASVQKPKAPQVPSTDNTAGRPEVMGYDRSLIEVDGEELCFEEVRAVRWLMAHPDALKSDAPIVDDDNDNDVEMEMDDSDQHKEQEQQVSAAPVSASASSPPPSLPSSASSSAAAAAAPTPSFSRPPLHANNMSSSSISSNSSSNANGGSARQSIRSVSRREQSPSLPPVDATPHRGNQQQPKPFNSFMMGPAPSPTINTRQAMSDVLAMFSSPTVHLRGGNGNNNSSNNHDLSSCSSSSYAPSPLPAPSAPSSSNGLAIFDEGIDSTRDHKFVPVIVAPSGGASIQFEPFVDQENIPQQQQPQRVQNNRCLAPEDPENIPPPQSRKRSARNEENEPVVPSSAEKPARTRRFEEPQHHQQQQPSVPLTAATFAIFQDQESEEQTAFSSFAGAVPSSISNASPFSAISSITHHPDFDSDETMASEVRNAMASASASASASSSSASPLEDIFQESKSMPSTVIDPFEASELARQVSRIEPYMSSPSSPLVETISASSAAEMIPCSSSLKSVIKRSSGSGSSKTRVPFGASRSLVVHNHLGSGAFAQVFSASSEQESSPSVALKLLQSPMATLAVTWESYIANQIQSRITSQPIKNCFATCKGAVRSDGGESAAILMDPLGEYGTLQDYINLYKKQGKTMEEPLVMFYVIEMLRMVESLHSVGILHGDIKPDNLLIRNGDCPAGDSGELQQWDSLWTPDSHANVEQGGWSTKGLLLIDYGRSVDMNLYGPNTRFTGTCHASGFQCVEMLSGRPWTQQLDTFGIAAVTHCLLFGEYMEVVRPEEGSGGRWRIKNTLKRIWRKEMWEHLFDTLLNVPDCDAQPSLPALRQTFEAYLSNPANVTKAKFIKAQLCRQNIMWAESRQSASSSS